MEFSTRGCSSSLGKRHARLSGLKAHRKLKLPEYNGIDFVSYAVSCDVSPDRIVIREWDASEEGNIQAEPDSETVCEETLFADLKPDKIYEITAEWKEELLEERGFCGEASYELRTE